MHPTDWRKACVNKQDLLLGDIYAKQIIWVYLNKFHTDFYDEETIVLSKLWNVFFSEMECWYIISLVYLLSGLWGEKAVTWKPKTKQNKTELF